MLHAETVQILPDAKVAVLFIHGICGTPEHFRKLLPLEQMVPKAWSVRNLLLDGHGKGVQDFANSSMKRWKQQAFEAFSELADSHDQVILVAHSMGTLFSIEMALHRPEKVAGLFLIAVPLRTCPRLFGIRNILRLTMGCLDLKDPVQAATKTVCGIQTTKKLWQYAPWVPRIVELLREMYATDQRLSGLKVPAVAYQSEKDELVANVSGRILERSGKLQVRHLHRSTHFYYHPKDIQRVQADFRNVMENWIN